MKLRLKIPLLLICLVMGFCLISSNSHALSMIAPICGLGEGATQDEAKKNSFDDLASLIQSRVYSKFSVTEFRAGGQEYSEASRYLQVISNVPILNPKVEYFDISRGVKAVSCMDNATAYVKKLNEIVLSINNNLNNAKRTENMSLKFGLLEGVLPLYDEYARYKIVPDILYDSSYQQPMLSKEAVMAEYLEMMELPPDLVVAADILTKGFVGLKNVYVDVPVTTMERQTTEFGLFFQNLLKGRIHYAQKENANNILRCSYADFTDYLLMECSMTRGGSIVKSSGVKIPVKLLSRLEYKPKLSPLAQNKGSLSANLRISSESAGNVIKDGDSFTLLVKLNKPAYVYLASCPPRGKGGACGVFEIGGQGGFLMYVGDEKVNKWVSVGRFKAGFALPANSVYLFALAEPPMDSLMLLPPYLKEKLFTIEKSSIEVMSDLVNIFNTQKVEKMSTMLNTMTGGK